MGNTRHQQARWGSAAWSPGQREPRRGRLRRSESMKPRQGRGRTGAARAGHRRGPRPGQPQLRVWTRKRSVRKSTPARGRGRSLSRDGSAGHCGPGGRTRPLTVAAPVLAPGLWRFVLAANGRRLLAYSRLFTDPPFASSLRPLRTPEGRALRGWGGRSRTPSYRNFFLPPSSHR